LFKIKTAFLKANFTHPVSFLYHTILPFKCARHKITLASSSSSSSSVAVSSLLENFGLANYFLPFN